MTTNEFKCALKEVIARRGVPQLIVSDNAKTFIATNKWLKLLQKDDDMNNYLATNNIEWRFNMSRAPWWGGFFERLIGVMKSTLAKVIGNAFLSYKELEEVFLDVECHMNNRPLCYVGEDFENQVVTPNILIRGKTSVLLDESTLCFDDVSVKEVRKRLRFLQKCKDDIRKRWTKEYLYSLEERTQKKVKANKVRTPTVGALVLIKDSILQKKGRWKLGRIQAEIRGKDGVLRGYKLLTGNGYVIERPLQLVADLEIQNDTDEQNKVTEESEIKSDIGSKDLDIESDSIKNSNDVQDNSNEMQNGTQNSNIRTFHSNIQYNDIQGNSNKMQNRTQDSNIRTSHSNIQHQFNPNVREFMPRQAKAIAKGRIAEQITIDMIEN